EFAHKPPALNLPEANLSAGSRHGYGFSVRADRERLVMCGMLKFTNIYFTNIANYLSAPRIDDSDRVVIVIHAYNCIAVRSECAMSFSPYTFDCSDRSSCMYIPKPDRSVVVAGQNLSAVRTENN